MDATELKEEIRYLEETLENREEWLNTCQEEAAQERIALADYFVGVLCGRLGHDPLELIMQLCEGEAYESENAWELNKALNRAVDARLEAV